VKYIDLRVCAQDLLRLDKLSAGAAKHSAESTLRQFKVVQTSVDSLLVDLRTLQEAGYQPVEPLQLR
jgi:hypothetical protein